MHIMCTRYFKIQNKPFKDVLFEVCRSPVVWLSQGNAFTHSRLKQLEMHTWLPEEFPKRMIIMLQKFAKWHWICWLRYTQRAKCVSFKVPQFQFEYTRKGTSTYYVGFSRGRGGQAKSDFLYVVTNKSVRRRGEGGQKKWKNIRRSMWMFPKVTFLW